MSGNSTLSSIEWELHSGSPGPTGGVVFPNPGNRGPLLYTLVISLLPAPLIQQLGSSTTRFVRSRHFALITVSVIKYVETREVLKQGKY